MSRLVNVPRSVWGALQLSVDLLDCFLNTGRHAELTALDNVRKTTQNMAPSAQYLWAGLNLVDIAMHWRHTLERDLVMRLMQAVSCRDVVIALPSPFETKREHVSDPKDIAFTAEAPSQPVSERATPASHRGIHITVRPTDSPVMIPLQLRNRRQSRDIITLRVIPFRGQVGAALPVECVTFEPSRLELPSQSVGTAQLLMRLPETLKSGETYRAEILIEGTEPKRIPLAVTILPLAIPGRLDPNSSDMLKEAGTIDDQEGS